MSGEVEFGGVGVVGEVDSEPLPELEFGGVGVVGEVEVDSEPPPQPTKRTKEAEARMDLKLDIEEEAMGKESPLIKGGLVDLTLS